VPSNTTPDIRKPSDVGAVGDVGAAAEEGGLELELPRSHAAGKDMATTNTAIGSLIAWAHGRCSERKNHAP
jgi:hypothetical protein